MSCLPANAFPETPPVQLSEYDPFSNRLHTVIAAELREMGERLTSLAASLTSDEYFLHTYVEELQAFDYLIQHADECSNLLERIAAGENSLEALAHVRLGAVQDRLRAAFGGA